MEGNVSFVRYVSSHLVTRCAYYNLRALRVLSLGILLFATRLPSFSFVILTNILLCARRV